MTLQRATPHKHDIDGEEARLSAIADQALLSMVNDTQAVIHFKIDGTIITANHNFLSTLGYRLDEVVGNITLFLWILTMPAARPMRNFGMI